MEISGTAGKSVLIVEDNALNMRLFSALVSGQGHRVLQATDGPRGLDLARQESPDLIVMDVQLPGMSGLEVTRMLKDNPETADIPIIVTTAFGLRGDEKEVRDSGCDAFIAKPIGLSEFVDLVEDVMRCSARERQHMRRVIEARLG